MWFRKLKIKNVGPFEDFSVDLTRGSIGVFGRNGKGKSTLLNLMYGLVENDFGRFAGVKVDCVRNTADPKAESLISGEIEHNGRVLKITRRFRGKPLTSLTVDDEKPIEDTEKAQAKITEVLGIDKKLLDLYVFKEQHRVYDFLTNIPSDRAKAYATLCRTEGCEDTWTMLGNFLNKDKELNTEIVDNSDEITGRIAEIELELSSLAERKTHEEELLLSPKSYESANTIVRRRQRCDDLKEELIQTKRQIKDIEERVETVQARVAEKRAEIETLSEKVDKRAAKANDTRAAIKGFEQYQVYRRRRKRLKDEAEELEIEESKKFAPEEPNFLDQYEALKKESVRVENELDAAKKLTNAFKNTGMVECPTCKTPVDHLKEHLEAERKKVAEFPKVLSTLNDKIATIDEYKSKSKKYREWKIDYDARVKANKAERESLKDVTAPDGDVEELQAWLKKYDDLVKALREAKEYAAEDEQELLKRNATLKARKERLAEVRKSLEDNEETDEMFDKATQRLAEHKVATNKIAALEGEAKGLVRQRDDKSDELKKLRKKLKRTKRIKQMAKVIEAARDVFHRDRLPNRVATTNLSRMEGDVNENLTMFGDPYWVEANDQLSFTVHKPGEPPQPAERLSTGQRVILALSFWPAVISLFSSDLGMLALDEPTANLDAENRKFLREALSAMTAKARGERQLIMVTHDPDLRTAFDQIVDLGA